MSGSSDRSGLGGLLLWVAVGSAAGAAATGAVCGATRRLAGVQAQVLLTFIGLLLGAVLMRVQLIARRRLASRRLSALLAVGVAVIFISQAAFLTLVWTGWKQHPWLWRTWWVSMVPSVFVTHMLLLRAAVAGRMGVIERVTDACVLWAGVMILWLGLRRDMLADIPPAYLWIGLAPAAGTVAGSIWLMVRWLLSKAPASAIGRRALAAGIIMSYLVTLLAGFYVGRATAGRGRELREDPGGLVAAARKDVPDQAGRDLYSAQSHVAEYLGDTRIVGREPFIRVEQIERLQDRLKPGDIILERRNWYLSNPFLPGFWPHGALYIGRIEDLKRLGIAEAPAVRRHLQAYQALAADKRPNTIIEAVSEGVIFNSLTHSLHADYVAVLRPRLDDKQVAAAIARAFEHLGKPYDFNFDFDDTGKLVCTQLVYLAYQGMVDFELKRVMGRNTLPAVEIARKYVAERTRPDRQLDFVLFLDGVPGEGTAREASEGEFCRSVDRPRELVEP